MNALAGRAPGSAIDVTAFSMLGERIVPFGETRTMAVAKQKRTQDGTSPGGHRYIPILSNADYLRKHRQTREMNMLKVIFAALALTSAFALAPEAAFAQGNMNKEMNQERTHVKREHRHHMMRHHGMIEHHHHRDTIHKAY